MIKNAVSREGAAGVVFGECSPQFTKFLPDFAETFEKLTTSRASKRGNCVEFVLFVFFPFFSFLSFPSLALV